MLNQTQIAILGLSLISLLNIFLVLILWLALKKRTSREEIEPKLDPESVRQLEEKALKHLEYRVAAAVRDFDTSLSQTVGQLDEKLASLVINVIDREMKSYKDELENARVKAITNLEKVQAAADDLQKQQRSAMEAEIEKEKKLLVEKIDQKLSDIMSSYLIESLGKEIDLGAQSKFLLASLDQNKEQLKKDILGEY